MYSVTFLTCIASLLFLQAAPAAGQRTQQSPTMDPASALNGLKVPSESPAYYCSDPSNDIFQIRRFDFIPTNARIPFHRHLNSGTDDFPWLNITGSVNGRRELGPLYDSLLCDIDVFQEISVPRPGGDHELHDHDMEEPVMHHTCPPKIQMGYAVVSSPPMPLSPQTVSEGTYELRAEATTQDGRRIFCIEGSFDVTT